MEVLVGTVGLFLHIAGARAHAGTMGVYVESSVDRMLLVTCFFRMSSKESSQKHSQNSDFFRGFQDPEMCEMCADPLICWILESLWIPY